MAETVKEGPSLDALAQALESIAKAQALNHKLWDATAVAAYLDLNADYCRRHILTRSDFPRALHLPGRGVEPIVRYQPADVREWAERCRA